MRLPVPPQTKVVNPQLFRSGVRFVPPQLPELKITLEVVSFPLFLLSPPKNESQSPHSPSFNLHPLARIKCQGFFFRELPRLPLDAHQSLKDESSELFFPARFQPLPPPFFTGRLTAIPNISVLLLRVAPHPERFLFSFPPAFVKPGAYSFDRCERTVTFGSTPDPSPRWDRPFQITLGMSSLGKPQM